MYKCFVIDAVIFFRIWARLLVWRFLLGYQPKLGKNTFVRVVIQAGGLISDGNYD